MTAPQRGRRPLGTNQTGTRSGMSARSRSITASKDLSPSPAGHFRAEPLSLSRPHHPGLVDTGARQRLRVHPGEALHGVIPRMAVTATEAASRVEQSRLPPRQLQTSPVRAVQVDRRDPGMGHCRWPQPPHRHTDDLAGRSLRGTMRTQ